MATEARYRGWAWVVILAVLAGGGFAWRWYAQRPKDTSVDYKTAVVGRGDIIQTVIASGQINPVTNVQVGSQVSGIIKNIKVDFNSQVTNDQVIALIDPSTYQLNLIQAEAEVASAEAARAQAELEHRRAETLWRGKLLADSDYEKTQVSLQQAEATKKMSEAALERARVDLARTVITAPVNGVVISRNVEVGQTVAASFSTPTLFLIANDLTKMQIEAMVSEADVGGLEVGQRVEFTVDAFPTRKFEGLVKQVRYAPITNQNVVNYVTVVDVNNPERKLRPGMTATASIIIARTNDVLRLPNGAFLFRPREGSGAKGQTNASPELTRRLATRSGSTNAASTNGPVAPSASAGPPTPPWVAEGRRPNGPDEVRQWLESLPPEQREPARQRMRDRMRAAGGGEGGSGGGGRGGPGSGASRAGAAEVPTTRTVYVLDKTSGNGKGASKPRAVTVKTGISDGTYSEIAEGLNEGDVVVTGVNLPTATTATAARPGGSPFGPAFGGMRPR